MRGWFVLGVLMGCTGGGTADDGEFTLTSPVMEDGDELPSDLVCEQHGGDGVSPPLAWTNAPEDGVGFALIMDHYPSNSNPDVDTPNHYWLLWDISSDVRSLSRGNVESVGVEGSDKDGVGTGYTPPCSQDDAEHEYTIHLYALSGTSELPEDDDVSVDWTELTDAIDGLVLDEASLTFVD